jgi:hypothetical protein
MYCRYCKNIEVTINPDNSITVEDDGRGIPVGMNHKAGKSALEVVYTVLHAGGKFGGGGYKVSGGLHGVGASVVNALSTKLCVEVYKEGQVYFQSYHIGKPDEPVKVIGTCDSEKHGTKVTFHPDPEIFEETVYDYDTLKQRLRETAFLTKGLRIVLTDTREESHHCHEFHYAGGSLYEVSPWSLSWDDENYYLIAYDSSEGIIKHFRVDKMLYIKSNGKGREGRQVFKSFDMAAYARKMFGMYGGKEEWVRIECDNSFAGVMIDRFGKDVSMIRLDDKRFMVNVEVAVSRQFLAWIMGLGEGVTLAGPDNVVEMMNAEIDRLIKQYKK